VKAKPELAKAEPFKTVLSGNREAIAKLSLNEAFGNSTGDRQMSCAGTLRRGEQAGLDRDQHEGRLEADFLLRPLR